MLKGRVGPACRAPISETRLYRRSAFEPTDVELGLKTEPTDDQAPLEAGSSAQPKAKKEEDEDLPDVGELLGSSKKENDKGKGKAKVKAKRSRRPVRSCRRKRTVVTESDEDANVDDLRVPEVEDDNDDDFYDDDLSDFIVEDGEDEEEKDMRREEKKRLGKKKAVEVYSDSSDSDDEPMRRRRGNGTLAALGDIGRIETISETVPSTKMKVSYSALFFVMGSDHSLKHMMERLEQVARDHPDEKVCSLVYLYNLANPYYFYFRQWLFLSGHNVSISSTHISRARASRLSGTTPLLVDSKCQSHCVADTKGA